MPQYRIIGGYSFIDTDGSLKTGGQLIQLDADLAALHTGKVEPEPVAEPAAEPAAATAEPS